MQVPSRVDALDYIPILALGMLCALVGIAIMRGVTLTEELFRSSRVPGWLRPMFGGIAVGTLALVTPAVLSSGHGALGIVIEAPYSLSHVAMLVVLKSMASAISIGSGFRGGLFFASLFLGALVGKPFAGTLAIVSTAHAVSPVVCALVGMSALAVGHHRWPVDHGLPGPGEHRQPAADRRGARRLRDLGADRPAHLRLLLRHLALPPARRGDPQRRRYRLDAQSDSRPHDAREMRTVRADTPIAAFKRDFPLGAHQRVIVLDRDDRYAGIVLPAEVHADADENHRVSDLLHYTETVLLPQMTIKEAVAMFENAESDALAVVDSAEDAPGHRPADRAVRTAPLQRRTRPPAAESYDRREYSSGELSCRRESAQEEPEAERSAHETEDVIADPTRPFTGAEYIQACAMAARSTSTANASPTSPRIRRCATRCARSRGSTTRCTTRSTATC